jgi:hypothetical protein
MGRDSEVREVVLGGVTGSERSEVMPATGRDGVLGLGKVWDPDMGEAEAEADTRP